MITGAGGPALLALLALLLASCAADRRADTDADTSMVVSRGMADSLVLSTPRGAEVWFTAARPAMDSTGTICVERTMEIRWDGMTRRIPLLYTGSAPRLVNDSTIEALLFLHCRPMSLYRVDLRTGQPLRVQ